MSCWCKQQGLQGGCATKFDYSIIPPEKLVDGAVVVFKRDPAIDLSAYRELAKGISVLAEETQGHPVRMLMVIGEGEGLDVTVLNAQERSALLQALLAAERCTYCGGPVPHKNNEECSL